MVLPLPDALSNFSLSALDNVTALSALTASVPNVQATVQNNIGDAATGAVAGTGDLFEGAADTINAQANTLVDNIANQVTGSITQLGDSLNSAFATGLTQAFSELRAPLDQITPVLSIFKNIQSLASTSLFADAFQAYSSLNKSVKDIQNICRRADALTAEIITDLGDLLVAQGVISFAEVAQRNVAFFESAKVQMDDVLEKFIDLQESFLRQGKFDPIKKAALCASQDAFALATTIGNTFLLEYEEKRKKIFDKIDELRVILRNLPTIINSTIDWIPDFVESSSIGKLFNFVQTPILREGLKFLEQTRDKMQSVIDKGQINARAAVDISYDVAAQSEAVKSFVCILEPSDDVINAPELGNLNTGYNSLTSDLVANDIQPVVDEIEEQVNELFAAMRVGGVRDNSSDLSTKTTDFITELTSLAVLLGVICPAAFNFNELFDTESIPFLNRGIGGPDLYSDTNLDRLRQQSITNEFAETTDAAVINSTNDGELAAAIADELAQLPEGFEKDQGQKVYDSVFARHQSKVFGLDLKERQNVDVFLVATGEEAFRASVNKISQTFSGLDPALFDNILL